MNHKMNPWTLAVSIMLKIKLFTYFLITGNQLIFGGMFSKVLSFRGYFKSTVNFFFGCFNLFMFSFENRCDAAV